MNTFASIFSDLNLARPIRFRAFAFAVCLAVSGSLGFSGSAEASCGDWLAPTNDDTLPSSDWDHLTPSSLFEVGKNRSGQRVPQPCSGPNCKSGHPYPLNTEAAVLGPTLEVHICPLGGLAFCLLEAHEHVQPASSLDIPIRRIKRVDRPPIASLGF